MEENDCSDFEEDIILPNSPLGHYVKELGDSEANNLFDECNLEENNGQCTKSPINEITKTSTFSFKSFFREKYKNFVCTFFSLFLPKSHLKSGEAFIRAFLSQIEKNNLLIDDDRTLITSLTSDESKTMYDLPLTVGTRWILLASFAALVSILCINTLINPHLIYLVLGIISISLCIYICCLVYFNTLSNYYTNACQELSLSTNSIALLQKVIKDCIRLIQESELIARGFTMVSVLGIAEHLELSKTLPILSSNRQFTVLRQCIFTWMKDIFIDFRRETLLLTEKLPVPPVYSFPHTLASIELDEFGSFLNSDVNSSQTSQLTNNFSIHSLKTMRHLMEMQVSEFLKHVILRVTFSSKNDKEEDCVDKVNDMICLKSIMKPLDKKMGEMYQKAFKTYRFYKSIEASYVSDNSKETISSIEPKTPLSDLKISVHNMSLHLKAALLRCIEVETSLDSDISSDLNDENLQKISHLLKTVNSEFSVFNDCYNDCNGILDRYLNPFELLPSELPLLTKVQVREDLPAKVERCDMEPVIQDEVFEAVLTNVSENNLNPISNSEFKESHKNVEMASFLMKELKNVLVIKADEHRAREQVALAKKVEHGDISLSVDGDSKKTENDCVLKESESVNSNKAKHDDIAHETFNSNGNTEQKITSNSFHLKGSEVDESYHLNIEDEINQLSDATFPDKDCFNRGHQSTSFSASIALLAAQRQKVTGLMAEEFIDGSDESDNDSS